MNRGGLVKEAREKEEVKAGTCAESRVFWIGESTDRYVVPSQRQSTAGRVEGLERWGRENKRNIEEGTASNHRDTTDYNAEP